MAAGMGKEQTMGTAVVSDILQLVTFNLGAEEYGIDILKVQEIIRMVEITAVPNTPDYVVGVINLRGRVIPVISMRKKLGLEAADADTQTRIVVVDVGITVGMVVDSVSEVLRLPAETVEPPPPLARAAGSEFIRGVGKLQDRLLILLDIEKLLGQDEIQGISMLL